MVAAVMPSDAHVTRRSTVAQAAQQSNAAMSARRSTHQLWPVATARSTGSGISPLQPLPACEKAR
jgi:hypothetical protein